VSQKKISFTIDGKPASALPGETVLSAARKMGIEIPALCHHDAVAPYGACRLCVVEVFWGDRSKLVTSCIYVPYEGDRVETDNERVRRTRRAILELLLARCPGAEVVRNLAREYGVSAPRFGAGEAVPGPDNCILCGLCVRVCAQVMGRHAIGYADRGADRLVTAPFRASADECVGCGACAEICPTGAISCEDLDGVRVMKELGVRLPLVKCRVCGEFFATEKHLRMLEERLKITRELAETCPRCRGREHLETLARTAGPREATGVHYR
jgi:predicted molibdopterin-dependent oxidoreductase YjgC